MHPNQFTHMEDAVAQCAAGKFNAAGEASAMPKPDIKRFGIERGAGSAEDFREPPGPGKPVHLPASALHSPDVPHNRNGFGPC